jgi:putative membrane protein
MEETPVPDAANPYQSFDEEDLILRDELAIDRTVLANERTFLAYVRTSLAFAIVGGTCLHIPGPPSYRVLGAISIALAVITLAVGGYRGRHMHRRITVVRDHQRADARRVREE